MSRLERRIRAAHFSSLILMAIWVPTTALAAAQAVLSADVGTNRFWIALIAVQILGFFGYAASSLPQWAKWLDVSGDVVAIAERRLKIIQGLFIAFLSANIAYVLGYYYGGVAEIPSFIAAAGAAYLGDKFLSPLAARITGKATA